MNCTRSTSRFPEMSPRCCTTNAGRLKKSARKPVRSPRGCNSASNLPASPDFMDTRIVMAEGKWISNLKPDAALDDAARHVLFVRLQVVKDYLPKAALEADDDSEYVHQLRVGTRRADAALRIFGDCLPKKIYKKARRRLRQLRRAAGATRDWDVFLDRKSTRL